MNNVLEYLEESCKRSPNKTAAMDERISCTYRQLTEEAKCIGTMLLGKTDMRKPIVVFMDKGVTALKTFMGILYAGCFYTLLDPSFPADRIGLILKTLKNDIVITEPDKAAKLTEAGFEGEILTVSDLYRDVIADEEALAAVRNKMVDTDPVYCNFTSGSTGIPKGVLICHRSVIDFIDCFTDIFNITGDDVIGNQAPFDFDVSVKDIYSTMKTGATLVIIPKAYFMFPNRVVDMLEEKNVTTLIWAVSALCLLSRLHGLKYKIPSHINKILFSGEMMPVKQLNLWKSCYPDALFVNLYGPTEITCNCTYYVLDRTFEEGDILPMGNAFPNERVMLLDEADHEITKKSTFSHGEICVAGSCLALGYYNNPEMTAKHFVQNPLQTEFPEIIYRTGDLAYYNDEGLLCFAGRKDFQIKHMGHRIELEEIEGALNAVSIVEHACCFYDEEAGKIVACYVGGDDKKLIVSEMKKRVPEYMVPNIFKRMDELPLTKNGKTDRRLLKDCVRK